MASKVRASTVPPPSHTGQLASSLSLLCTLCILCILSFFVDALRREKMAVPWPILLVFPLPLSPLLKGPA